MNPGGLALIGIVLFAGGYVAHRAAVAPDLVSTLGDAGIICCFLAALWGIAS